MTAILACVDGSVYSTSVCDHAAWLCGRLHAGIVLVHVDETLPGGASTHGRGRTSRDVEQGEILKRATERLAEQGIDNPASLSRSGQFFETVGQMRGGELLVLGKRGLETDGTRDRLGSNVRRLLREQDRALLLVSQVFLPISRVLVLIDGRMDRRRAVELVARQPGLVDLDIDLVVVESPGSDPGEKLDWARRVMGATHAEIFPLRAQGVGEAAQRYMESRRSDLLVLSREVLSSEPEGGVAAVSPESLWRWRAPVLVC